MRAAKYIVVSGEIRGVSEYSEVVQAQTMPPLPDGWAYLGLGPDEPCSPDLHRVVDGAVVPRLAISAETLDRWRRERWNAARAYRETHAAGGCVTPLGRVNTDDASVRKITGAVVMAMASLAGGDPFEPIAWTMFDNSIVTHDASAMIAMGVAVGRFVDACQQVSVVIRAAIDTSDEPATVDITAGYPA